MFTMKEKILKLRILLRYYDYLYFSLDAPRISDLQYDILSNQLKKLEKDYKFSDLDTSDNIGSLPLDNFDLDNHFCSMLSLDNTFNIKGFIKFFKNINKYFQKDKKIFFFCDLKFDGVGLSLLYEKGELIRALTRGDGKVGEDVTENARMIKNIPLFLLGNNIPEVLEVRGEVCMLKSDFKILNILSLNNKERLFSNTRNAAAGSLRQNNPNITKKRNLFFYCYGYSFFRGLSEFDLHSDQLFFLKKIGFSISKYFLLTDNFKKILNFYYKIIEIRNILPFDIDGIVIKVNKISLQKKIGCTSKFPKWALAFKFNAKEVKTRIIDVKYQVGRTGLITPIAYFKPVYLSGVILKKASLYNKNEVNKLNLFFNDLVIIKRIGDVIPKIKQVILHERSKDAKKIIFSKYCPSCNSILYDNKKKTITKCLAIDICTEQKIKVIEHFFSKSALYAEGFGVRLIRKLVLYGYVHKPIDCFFLDVKKISQLKYLGKISASKIIDSIKFCRNTTLNKFIYALGINDIGIETSNYIVNYFGSLKNILNCNINQLYKIQNIGTISAKSFIKFITNKNNIRNINDLVKKSGINFINKINNIKKNNQNTIFMNKNIVLTGTFTKFSRILMINKIVMLGGIILNSISKKIDFLIIGKNPGSKILKAKKNNIKMILEDEIYSLLI